MKSVADRWQPRSDPTNRAKTRRRKAARVLVGGSKVRSDHWFFRVFLDRARLILTLAKMPNPDPEAYEFRAEELKDVSARLDGLYAPKQPGELWLFVEAQFYLASDFYLKWIRKVFSYLLKYSVRDDWRLLVLFGSRVHEPSATHGISEWVSSGRLQVIYLDELPEYPDIPLELAVVKLVVSKKEDLIEKAKYWVSETKKKLAEFDAQQRVLSLIQAIVVSNFQNFSIQEIETMLQLNDIRESRFFKEVEAIATAQRDREIIARMKSQGRTAQEIAEALGLSDEQVRTALERSVPRN